MKNKIVEVPTIQTPIAASPGFAKKTLADFKLDIMGLCGFGCRYCSSYNGNYLRIRRRKFADLTAEQLGKRILPTDDPSLTFVWPDLIDNLQVQLAGKRKSFGAGKTLVFSMLTDAFSSPVVKQGITRQALELLLEKTSFRIRVLTKSAKAASPEFINLYKQALERFLVGLSIGSSDDSWARKIELGASLPSERINALHALQDAGIPTFGMLCPVFPDMLEGSRLESLIDKIHPDVVEEIFAEPYNDRANWQIVRDGYAPGSAGFKRITEVFGTGKAAAWSRYATDLYLRLREKAEAEGWIGKLRYLLYEGKITPEDAGRIGRLDGMLLQGNPDENGKSKNAALAALQG